MSDRWGSDRGSRGGYDAKRGASEGFEEQATFKTRLVEYAENTVLLVDSSKLNQRSEYFFADPSEISEIITDVGADAETINRIRSNGHKITIADDLSPRSS
jgi:DeoR/GlpR family transcriptional regulator of sugar metabolism